MCTSFEQFLTFYSSFDPIVGCARGQFHIYTMSILSAFHVMCVLHEVSPRSACMWVHVLPVGVFCLHRILTHPPIASVSNTFRGAVTVLFVH